jgi:pyruvate/2-oxoglutarate dehydrogenase complex dihydrolipoamide dehydrogenase (E3) component
MKKYDVIIVGTGQATGTILGRLLELQKSVAVIESDETGGTCVNWGCTPTKTFIASARVAHVVQRSGEFGIDVQYQRTNFPRVMERVHEIRNSARDGFTTWLEDAVDYYRGFGSFVDSHTIAVHGTEIWGENIVIHTGTRARSIPIPGIERIDWLDNKKILDLKELPEHLVIIGGSYIGLEFAQAFHRLGSAVTILEKSPFLISREDMDMSEIARDILEGEGVACFTSVSISSIAQNDQHAISVLFEHNGSSHTITGSHVLVAVGRVPNTDELHLEQVGVQMDDRGFIQVDDFCRTNIPHIFALGDVNGKGAFTHTSVHDGQVFLSVLDGGDTKISDRIPTYALYTDPPLARVGMTEKQAMEAHIPYLITTKDMSTISRAKEKSETKGRIKIIVDQRDDTILGATVFGVGGDEIIGMIALAMQAGIRYQTIQETVIPHPTVAELIPWMFQGLHTEVKV